MIVRIEFAIFRRRAGSSALMARRVMRRSFVAAAQDRMLHRCAGSSGGRAWSHWPLSDRLYTLPAAAARKQNGNRSVADVSPREPLGPARLAGWRGAVGRRAPGPRHVSRRTGRGGGRGGPHRAAHVRHVDGVHAHVAVPKHLRD